MSKVWESNPVIWENCRRADETINLMLAARMTGCHITDQALDYLAMVERIQPVRSRQVAAVTIANALEISRHG